MYIHKFYLIIISLLLQIIAVATTSWSVLRKTKSMDGMPTYNLGIGIWSMTETIGDQQSTRSSDRAELKNRDNFGVLKALSILGILMTTVLIYFMYSGSNYEYIAQILSIICCLVVLIIWNTKCLEGETMDYYQGYSFILYVVSLVLLF